MNLLDPLPKTATGNQLIIVMPDRYSKLIHPISICEKRGSHAALTFINNWIMPDGIYNFLLAENGRQFVSKLFNSLGCLLGVKQLKDNGVSSENYRSFLAEQQKCSCKIALIRQRTPIELGSVHSASHICVQPKSAPIYLHDSILSIPKA